jgi:hypothetical protein
MSDEMTDSETYAYLESVFANVRFSFWMCPVAEHEKNGDLPTVEWRGVVAHCLTPGCDRTSERPAQPASPG